MKRNITGLAVAVAVAAAGIASADMFASITVGYGIFDSTGGSGLVVDEVGELITIRVVSGDSGIVTGGDLGYLLDLSLLGVELGFTEWFVTDVGMWQDYATGAAVMVGGVGVPYDADAWIVMTGSNTDEAYVANVGSLILDRTLTAMDPPQTVYFDGGGVTGAIANAIVIPEPATIGLMGIAGLGMFLARRKVRR